MPNHITTPQPQLSIVDNNVVTTSLQVAEYFQKRHDDVLKKIRRLCDEIGNGWCARNFAETQVEVKMPTGGTRLDKAYKITRDGFSLLAMGFTGKKALHWKLTYIKAFNAMEAQLYTPDNDRAGRYKVAFAADAEARNQKSMLGYEHQLGELKRMVQNLSGEYPQWDGRHYTISRLPAIAEGNQKRIALPRTPINAQMIANNTQAMHHALGHLKLSMQQLPVPRASLHIYKMIIEMVEAHRQSIEKEIASHV